MYSDQNGLRIKLPSFVANQLVEYLPEGVKATRYLVDLILQDLAKHKKESHTSDHTIPVRDNKSPS